MAVEEAIRSIITAGSTSVSDRIFLGEVPEGADLPLVRFARVSSIPQMTRAETVVGDSLGGTTQYYTSGESYRSNIQLEVWASNREQARTVENEIKPFLHGFRGIVNGQDLLSVSLELGLDDPFDRELRVFRRLIDTIVWYKE